MSKLLPTGLPMQEMNLVHQNGADSEQQIRVTQLQGVQCLWRYQQAKNSRGVSELVPIACIACDGSELAGP